MLSKIVSLLMVPVLFIYALIPALLGEKNDKSFNDEDLSQLTSISDYINYIQENGAPSFSTKLFFKVLSPVDAFRREMHGYIFSKDDEAYLDATVSEEISDLLGHIRDNSGLDIEALIGHLPNINGPAEFCNEIFNLDAAEFRKQIFAMRDECYANDNGTMGNLLYFFGVYFSIIDEMKIYAVASADNDKERVVMLDIVMKDGEKLTLNSGIIINTETGLAYAKDDRGILSLGFNCTTKDLVIYATVHSWQRNFGFMLLYDVLANSTPIFNMATRRYKFEYAGKEWMVQVWKGNYALVTNGAEVGFYNREPGSKGTFYNCASDDELREMTMEVYHGDKLLFSKGPEYHWWINGFQLNKVIYNPSDLTLKCTIVMPDEEMLKALTDAIDNEYSHDAKYTVDGLKLSIEW